MNSLKVVLSLSLIVLANNLFSQTNAVISSNDFGNLNFDDKINISQLEPETDYKSKINQLFGPAEDKKCSSDMFGESCSLIYQGFTLKFAFDDQLFNLSLNGSQRFFRYGPYQLKSGMNISELEIIFPEAYNKRYVLNYGSESKHVIALHVGNSDSDTILSFIFDPISNLVTQIDINYQLT